MLTKVLLIGSIIALENAGDRYNEAAILTGSNA